MSVASPTQSEQTEAQRERTGLSAEERYYLASQWQLMWQRFRRHRLAIIGGSVLLVLYLSAIFADFVSPYSKEVRFEDFSFRQPTYVHFFDDDWNFRGPFIYGSNATRDMETLQRIYEEDKSVRYPIHFFVRGESYKLLGLIETDRHLFGVDEPVGVFLFGTDSLGRDLFSRTLHGARLSLSIGLVGVALSFIIGLTLGGISGYFGGIIDTIIQRVIEFLISIPTIPLWLALSAALPAEWPMVRIYFGIAVILSLVSWGGLARVVRGKFLELRELDYVRAARVAGVSEATIIRVHLIPNFASYLIVSLTLAIPDMILAETALSFLGLGLRAPAVSWGVLLENAQNVAAVAIYWWTIIPAVFVVITVMAFNFLGDGMRDAADPYKS
ncbi:ABC transporter permease [Chloroflexi bacterium TSY]|nr:ABC transporter permease [Chloroflexi bacterium TSY]